MKDIEGLDTLLEIQKGDVKMKVILGKFDNGDDYKIYSCNNLVEGMRKLWEDKHNDLLGWEELDEEDTWFQEDMCQIVGKSGTYFAEYIITDVKEIRI